MDFKDLCKTRYSVRAYKPDLIPEDKMNFIKTCVQLAPSAVNKQPWKFIVITKESDREKLQQCYDKPWFKEAPVYIVACKNEKMAWTRRYDNKNHADIDLAIAIEHLCLAATSQGLGTCWVCNFRTQLIQELFDFGEDWEPVALVPLGFPAEEGCPEKIRKPIEETWENW